LPEYKNAGEHALKGQFLQAIPLFQRVIHVLESSVGSTSELALHTVVEQVKVLINQRDYDKAEQLLQQTQTRLLDKTNKSDVDVTNWEVSFVQWNALISFLRQENNSNQTASHLVDRLTDAEPSDLTLYAPAFSLKGLTHLYQGELEDAEDELQKAARWSQNLEQKMITLNNLGALTWTKLGHYYPILPSTYLTNINTLFHSSIIYLICFVFLILSGETFTERRVIDSQDITNVLLDESTLAWMRRDVLYFGYKAVDGTNSTSGGK